MKFQLYSEVKKKEDVNKSFDPEAVAGFIEQKVIRLRFFQGNQLLLLLFLFAAATSDDDFFFSLFILIIILRHKKKKKKNPTPNSETSSMMRFIVRSPDVCLRRLRD